MTQHFWPKFGCQIKKCFPFQYLPWNLGSRVVQGAKGIHLKGSWGFHQDPRPHVIDRVKYRDSGPKVVVLNIELYQTGNILTTKNCKNLINSWLPFNTIAQQFYLKQNFGYIYISLDSREMCALKWHCYWVKCSAGLQIHSYPCFNWSLYLTQVISLGLLGNSHSSVRPGNLFSRTMEIWSKWHEHRNFSLHILFLKLASFGSALVRTIFIESYSILHYCRIIHA